MNITHDQTEQRNKIVGTIRQWLNIAGDTGRYRINVTKTTDDGRQRVEIAQFYAPKNQPAVKYVPGEKIQFDPIDIRRFSLKRRVERIEIKREIRDFCKLLIEQWPDDLAIDDTAKFD